MTTNLNKNSPDCECQLDSMVQRTSRRIKVKPIEVEGVEEWKVEKILNKKKIRGVIKYLVQQKEFTIEYNVQKKKKDLENTKEVVAEFEGRINVKVQRQEKLDKAEKRDFRREELLGKYIVKMLYK